MPDNAGRIVPNDRITRNLQQIIVTALDEGIYCITVDDEKGVVDKLKFVKE